MDISDIPMMLLYQPSIKGEFTSNYRPLKRQNIYKQYFLEKESYKYNFKKSYYKDEFEKEKDKNSKLNEKNRKSVKRKERKEFRSKN